MGGLSYFTVRHFLLAGRESAAQHQAFNNAAARAHVARAGHQAAAVRGPARQPRRGVRRPLRPLPPRARPTSRRLSVSASIPVQLRKDVLGGTAATQTYRTAQGTAEIGIGIPIPSVHAFYFEVFDLSDLDHTLRVLGLTLFVAGVVTTLLGTGLGRFASVRSLRPLADVSRAAGAIAGGRPRHPARPRGRRPRPRRLHPVVQRHGRPAPGAHRARGALQLRRQPRAAVPPHHPGRRHRGAGGRPGQAAAALAGGPATAGRRPPPLPAHGGRPPRDVTGRCRLGRRLLGGGQRLRARPARRSIRGSGTW